MSMELTLQIATRQTYPTELLHVEPACDAVLLQERLDDPGVTLLPAERALKDHNGNN